MLTKRMWWIKDWEKGVWTKPWGYPTSDSKTEWSEKREKPGECAVMEAKKRECLKNGGAVTPRATGSTEEAGTVPHKGTQRIKTTSLVLGTDSLCK